jgi:hypothetical protein
MSFFPPIKGSNRAVPLDLGLLAEGVGPVEIAKRLGIGRTSVHRIVTGKAF